MHARLHARLDRRHGRWSKLVIGVAVLAGVIGLAAVAQLWSVALGSFAVGVAILHALTLRRPAATARDVTLRLGRGRLDVIDVDGIAARVEARELTGASVASIDHGESLVLALRDRPGEPLAIDVEGEENARLVRRVLGLGEHGFGAVCWETAPNDAELVRRAAAVAAMIAWGLAGLLLFLVALEIASPWAQSAMLRCFPLGVLVSLLAVVLGPGARKHPGSGPEIGRHALVVRGRSVPAGLAYSAIARASSVHGGVRVATHDGGAPLAIPMPGPRAAKGAWGPAIADRIALHINARASRRDDEDITTRAALRRAEPTLASWCAKLDAMTPAAVGSIYRVAAMEEATVWRVLEDPEAEGDERAAAARILSHAAGDERLLRVEDAIATMRDPETAALARAVIVHGRDEK